MVEGATWEGWYTRYRYARLRGRRIGAVLLEHLLAEQKGWASGHGKGLLSAASVPSSSAHAVPRVSRMLFIYECKNGEKQTWAFHQARGLGAVRSEDRQNQTKLKGFTEPGLDCGLESRPPAEDPTDVPIDPWLQLGSPSPKHLFATAVTSWPRTATYTGPSFGERETSRILTISVFPESVT